MKKKYKIALSALVLFLALSLGGSFYLVDFALCPNHRGRDLEESMLFMRQKYPYVGIWVDSLKEAKALKEVTLEHTHLSTKDTTVQFNLRYYTKKLHAYYIKAAQPTRRTAIIIHGYTDNAIRMFMIGHLYNKELGYNVLLPDLQFTGKSEGSHIQMGWNDRKDIINWIEAAHQLFGDSIQMAIHGISMGAATTMMVAGEKLPNSVKCFVEDCGYTSVWDQFTKELKEDFNLPSFPLLYLASGWCQVKYGWNFKEASALKQIKKCTKPMFFIHGDSDKYVPTRMVYELYKAKPEPKQLWITPGTTHANSYKNYTHEYVQRVRAFMQKYLIK
jgi:fermentation-respiration switch protein FrsA (DUF1100 family)